MMKPEEKRLLLHDKLPIYVPNDKLPITWSLPKNALQALGQFGLLE